MPVAPRVCIVYDCLYPHTVGGAERWYRSLAERLADRGHEVTYLTLRQWDGEDSGVPAVDVRAVGPRMNLYKPEGPRRILPPLIFGLGVFWHLLRCGRRYDVVHTGSMPFFGLLAAAALRRRSRYRLYVDWIEVWTLAYWQEYAGRLVGRVGWRIQWLAARTRHTAFAFAKLHAERLSELGYHDKVTVLGGLHAGTRRRINARDREPIVVFAGRHIPEKRVPSLVPALAIVRTDVPDVRAEIYGDGPDRAQLLALLQHYGLDGAVIAPGFVESSRVEDAIGRASCLVLPSRREGYGLVVVEAAAAGTPTVVVADPDNAATELVEEGVNGLVARSAEPKELAAAIVAVHKAGERLRESTQEWYARNAERLSIESSLETVAAAYEQS